MRWDKYPRQSAASVLSGLGLLRLGSFGSEAISKKYLVTYPDGSRKNIDRETRDSMLLSGVIRKTQDTKYRYIGELRTFHAFAELQSLYLSTNEALLRRFLPGSFVFELRGSRRNELLETPECMAMRMARA